MLIQHKNYKDQTYFVHINKLSNGKVKLHCSTECKGAIDAVPKGYEIHEYPNGRVVCRKEKPCQFNKNEVDSLKRWMSKHSGYKHFKIYPKDDTLEIYTPNSLLLSNHNATDFMPPAEPLTPETCFDTRRSSDKFFLMFNIPKKEFPIGMKAMHRDFINRLKEPFKNKLNYSSEMRFVLDDPITRTYYLEKRISCSEKHWTVMDGPCSLEALSKKHLSSLQDPNFYIGSPDRFGLTCLTMESYFLSKTNDTEYDDNPF